MHLRVFAVRRPKDPAQRRPELAETPGWETHYLLPASPHEVLAVHWNLLRTRPREYRKALALAWQMQPEGLRAKLRHWAYFLEGGLLAQRIASHALAHLHNHYGDSSGHVALFASAIGGLGLSYSIHGPSIFFEAPRWRLQEKAAHSSFIRCISEFCRSQVMLFTSPQEWSRLCVVHCGVRVPATLMRVHEGQVRRVLFVGRLARVKCVDVLLQAMSELSKADQGFVLEIVGDGEERQRLQELAVDLGLHERVRFLGACNPDQVRARLMEADVFVLPSLAEGVPVVLMEAMAAGVPVIATRVGGVSELVEHGRTGLLVPPGQVSGLAHALQQMIDDAPLRQRLSQAAYEHLKQHFNAPDCMAQLYEHFALACGETTKRAESGAAANLVSGLQGCPDVPATGRES